MHQHITKINKLSEVNGVDEVWHCNLRLLIAFISIYENRYVRTGSVVEKSSRNQRIIFSMFITLLCHLFASYFPWFQPHLQKICNQVELLPIQSFRFRVKVEVVFLAFDDNQLYSWDPCSVEQLLHMTRLVNWHPRVE